MKRTLFLCLVGLSFITEGFAQPSATYLNSGTFSAPPLIPPTIDATNFVNTGFFNISYTNISSAIPLFETSDTLNFTNKGVITGNTGFRFNTAPSSSGQRRMAANFYNDKSISVGSLTNTFFTNTLINNFFLLGGAKVLVSSTNIINPGVINIGLDGLLSLKGKNVDLTRGSVVIEGSDAFQSSSTNGGIFIGGLFNGGFANIGIFDRYWAAGINENRGIFFGATNAITPVEIATNSSAVAQIGSFTINNFASFVYQNQFSPSNNVIDIVLLQNTNSAVVPDVRFASFGGLVAPVVRWSAVVTNGLGSRATVITNSLYLEDFFSVSPGLPRVALNSLNLIGQPTFAPINYTFSRNFFGYTNLLAANANYDPQQINQNATNYFALYGVTVAPTTSLVPQNPPTASITNMPGRIEIVADNVLNLERVQVTGPNYLLLQSTNHFVGSTNAQISVPNCDIFLSSTNGSMVVSNLLAPYVPRMIGDIDMYSERWTNIVDGITNYYHVLMVRSALSPTSPSLIKDLVLRSTNLVVSDVLNATRSMVLDSERLTVVSNAPDFSAPFGQINLTSPDIVWAASLPRLRYLTNSGLISTLNSTFFGGARQPPYFTGTFTEPYQALVNHGTLAVAGASIWATYFENVGVGDITTNLPNITVPIPGVVQATVGPINLQADTSVLKGGKFSAVAADITVSSGSLVVSNHSMQAGRKLTFSIANSITDGGVASSNIWQVGDGFDLLVKPPTGDLLGTSITNKAPDLANVVNTWAGEDRGSSTAGFANNVAIGRLVLDGGVDCLFTFIGTGAQNAIYIDQLELKNYATNRSNPDFISLNIGTNMVVYFADAIIGNIDISEKLNGANGGRLRWIPGFSGPFSSTNITTASGNTFSFNRALAMSSSIDSDNDGIVNSADPTPFLTPDNITLSVQIVKQPKLAAKISWPTIANSTNFLYWSTNTMSGNWQLLTNFVQGPSNGLITVMDSAKSNAPCFYRVRVNPKSP
ncbi:MAG: hypothetical protein JWQ71_4889 [Pedosphaera sp.]|nr:hypothetical protein [Pedosphaera sp.]